jgi:hypothetical protein
MLCIEDWGFFFKLSRAKFACRIIKKCGIVHPVLYGINPQNNQSSMQSIEDWFPLIWQSHKSIEDWFPLIWQSHKSIEDWFPLIWQSHKSIEPRGHPVLYTAKRYIRLGGPYPCFLVWFKNSLERHTPK